MSRTLNQTLNQIIQGGTHFAETPGRDHHIKIFKIISLSAIVITLIFSGIFSIVGEYPLVRQCLLTAGIFIILHLFSVYVSADIGRPIRLLFGNIVVFYFANLFRGQADMELFFFCLIMTPFIYFSWEERRWYALSLLSLVLFSIGEIGDWSYLRAYEFQNESNFRFIRLFCNLATLHQIILGTYYFIFLSGRHKNQSQQTLKRLAIEYQKQVQSQKMSSLGEMAAGVAHEINNPLTVILGQSYRIRHQLEQKQIGEECIPQLDKIDKMVNRIVRIIKALKNFSRNSEHDPFEKIRFSELMTLTLDLCRERFKAGNIDLQVNQSCDPFVHCRPTEISQVLLNLLNNAYDAVQDQTHPLVRISCDFKEEMIEILIQDNGSGIPQDIRDKIMQPFYSTKEIGKGTGLGLSISKGLIESHQGTLSLLEDQDLTTFQVLIPYLEESKLLTSSEDLEL